MPIAYEWKQGRITWPVERRQGDGEAITVTFAADGVRRERSGVHARLSVIVNGANYAWTNCNIERVEDRTRLIKSVYRAFATPQEREAYDFGAMLHDFHEFCRGLWDAWSARDQPLPVKGCLKPLSFVLAPYLVDGSSTIIFAPGGKGKSTVALLMAVSVDAGVQTFWPVQQRRALFVNLERSADSIGNRIALVNRALGLPVERELLTLNARGRPFDALMEPLKRAIAKSGAGLVIVDSISRTGYGKLTDDDVANRVIDAGNSLGVAILWIGHTPRADETHLFGSTMFRNGADVEVRLHSQQRENVMGIGLEMTKANDVRPRPMQVLALEYDETGLKAVRKASTGEFPELTMGQQPSMADLVEAYLLENRASQAVDVAKALGLNPASVRTLLHREKHRFVAMERSIAGKTVTVWGVAKKEQMAA